MIASRGYFEDWQRTVKPMRYTADMTVSGKSMLLRSYQRAGFATEFVTCYFLSGSPPSLTISCSSSSPTALSQ